jgi:hypothetical protein
MKKHSIPKFMGYKNKIYSLNAYIIKYERYKIKNQILHTNEIAKENQLNPKIEEGRINNDQT